MGTYFGDGLTLVSPLIVQSFKPTKPFLYVNAIGELLRLNNPLLHIQLQKYNRNNANQHTQNKLKRKANLTKPKDY